jgi:hypothetical protein
MEYSEFESSLRDLCNKEAREALALLLKATPVDEDTIRENATDLVIYLRQSALISEKSVTTFVSLLKNQKNKRLVQIRQFAEEYQLRQELKGKSDPLELVGKIQNSNNEFFATVNQLEEDKANAMTFLKKQAKARYHPKEDRREYFQITDASEVKNAGAVCMFCRSEASITVLATHIFRM